MYLVVLDTETTGLPQHKHAAPVEVAAHLLDTESWEVEDSWSSLVCPDVIVVAEALAAQEIHGIPLVEIVQAPSPSEVVDQWDDFLKAHCHPPVTSYNARYDQLMLKRMGWVARPPVFWDGCIMLRAHKLMAKAGALPRNKRGGYKWPKLSEACDFFGIPYQGEHRASQDALMAAGVLVQIKQAYQQMRI